MTYLPPVHHQLDGSPTQGADCGPSAVIQSIEWATQGDVRPNVKQIRARMGVMSGPTTGADQERAVESYDKPSETHDRQPLRYQLVRDGSHADLVTVLENGRRWVNLQIDYAVLNGLAPRLSGDRVFRGKHSISAFGLQGGPKGRRVRVWDPLADGRRPGIPTGPSWWPLSVLLAAAAGFHGVPGEWSGGMLAIAKPIVDTTPEPPIPPEPDPCAACQAQLDEATALLAEADALADKLAQLLPASPKASAVDGAA